MYKLWYDFLSNYWFEESVQDRDSILHWMALVCSILTLVIIFWGIRAAVRAIIGSDSRGGFRGWQ